MNRTIWMYWEDAPQKTKPDYLNLCFDTIEKNRNDHEIIVVTPDTVRQYLPDISPRVFKIRKIAHRADYIRGHLLLKYGGVWLDSDVIILRPLDLAPYMQGVDFVGYGMTKGEPSINFFAAEAGCPLLEKWVAGMDRKLLGLIPKYKYKWTELGYNILWPHSRQYAYHHLEYKLVAPVSWKDWELFFGNDVKLADRITDETIAMMLFNKHMFDRLETMTCDEILQADNLLGETFRHALQ